MSTLSKVGICSGYTVQISYIEFVRLGNDQTIHYDSIIMLCYDFPVSFVFSTNMESVDENDAFDTVSLVSTNMC